MTGGPKKLVMGATQPDTPSMEEEWKKQELRATIRKYLPQMPDAVALCLKNGAELLLHQDAFAAGYHDDEYTLLGMMVKYAGLYGVNVRIIGKNHATF